MGRRVASLPAPAASGVQAACSALRKVVHPPSASVPELARPKKNDAGTGVCPPILTERSFKLPAGIRTSTPDTVAGPVARTSGALALRLSGRDGAGRVAVQSSAS